MTMSEMPLVDTAISTRLLTRIIVGLIAAWSLMSGVALTFFHGAASGALGAGVEDIAGQRLVGGHVLLLVPIYVLIAWKPEKYPALHWVPFAGQAVVFLGVGYNILSGVTEFSDGILPVAVSGIFLGLLAFIWITAQRAMAKAKYEADEALEEELPPEAPSSPAATSDGQNTTIDESLDSLR